MPDREAQLTEASVFLLDRGKDYFDQAHIWRLAQWGVSPAHIGTCVLIPAAWEWHDPLSLIANFRHENCPVTRNVSQLRFEIRGYSTLFAKSIAWFSTWPRDAVELEEFADLCQSDQVRTTALLCHQSCCINPHHIIREDRHNHLTRNACVRDAQALRRCGCPIPSHCERHDPPCLLQVPVKNHTILRSGLTLPRMPYSPSSRLVVSSSPSLDEHAVYHP